MALFGKKKKKRKSYEETAKKTKKAKRSRLHVVIGAVLFILVLAFGYRFASSSYFAISRVEIKNNQRVSSERISELTGISPGKNLLFVSSNKVNKSLKQEPWIYRVDVVRKLPDVLELNVIERQPIAVLAAPNGRFITDKDSMVIATAGEEQLPLISAEGIQNAQINNRVVNSHFQAGLSFISSLSEQMRRQMQEVKVDGQNMIIATTIEGTMIDYGLLEDVDKKNYVLNVILSKAKAEGQALKMVDLKSVSNPVVKR